MPFHIMDAGSQMEKFCW